MKCQNLGAVEIKKINEKVKEKAFSRVLTLFIPGFFGSFQTGEGGGRIPPPLRNFQNLSNRNKTYRRYSMSKNLSFIYVTCGDDVTSRDNYIMMSKQPPSWIRHLGFQNFSKTSENR